MVAVSKGDNAAQKRQHAYKENQANKRANYARLISASPGRFHVSPGNVVANSLSRGLFGGIGRGR